MKHRSMIALATAGIISLWAIAAPSLAGTDTLKDRGKQLRAEIESVYKYVKVHRSARENDPTRTDISETVIKYIPTGISFDDAETILRSAGFSVIPRPKIDPDPTHSKKKEKVEAIITPFELHLLYSYYSSVDVVLFQESPGDYGRVGKIAARIRFPAS